MAEWPAQNKYIGQPTTRVDARPEGHGCRTLQFGHPGQRLALWHDPPLKMAGRQNPVVNFDKARSLPGIKAVVLARETPFTVRYYGEEIAAVAATTKQACLDALRAIEITAEPREPFVVREDDARKADSPQVWEDVTNAPAPRERKTGDVDAAFAECAAVIEGFYTTPVQIHHPMETHGNTVSWTEEGVTAWASTQGISSVRDGLAGS